MVKSRNRAQREYDSLVVPQLLGLPQEGPTFVRGEVDLDVEYKRGRYLKMHSSDTHQVDCYGTRQHTVFGCQGLATRLHFLIPWVEMKKRGFPAEVRQAYWTTFLSCENCYLLYDSKHRKLKNAWVMAASKHEHKAPARARYEYEDAHYALETATDEKRTACVTKLDQWQERYIRYITICVGEELNFLEVLEPYKLYGVTPTNIDITSLRSQGTITIALYVA